MAERLTYPVRVEREGTLWVATIEGLPVRTNNVTDVEHFAELEREVRDFVATVCDCEPDDFDLTWHYVQGDNEYTLALEQLREWDERLAECSARMAELTATRDDARAAAIQSMQKAGLPLRAIGDVLDLSHQRVGQLLKRRARSA
jgi:hypothetical protein